jgi:hypothetical protein
MIEYVLFIALFVFLKDNDCCQQPNTPIVNVPTPDLVNIEVEPIIIIETFIESIPETFPEILSEILPEILNESISEILNESISEILNESISEILPETFWQTLNYTFSETIPQTHDFEPDTHYLQDLEHGVLVEAYDLRLSVFPKNTTRVPEENKSIIIEMKRNNFIFQIYS